MSHYIKTPKALKKKLSTKAFYLCNITVDVFYTWKIRKLKSAFTEKLNFSFSGFFFFNILVLIVRKLKPWDLTEVALCQKCRIQTYNSDINSGPPQQIRMGDRHKS